MGDGGGGGYCLCSREGFVLLRFFSFSFFFFPFFFLPKRIGLLGGSLLLLFSGGGVGVGGWSAGGGVKPFFPLSFFCTLVCVFNISVVSLGRTIWTVSCLAQQNSV